MRLLAVVTLVAVVSTGCSSGDDAVDPPDTTSSAPTTTTSASTTTSTISPADPAVTAARQAVIDAGVMGEEFARTSVVAEMNRGSDTIEIILVPADRDLIGATAVVVVRAEDLSVVEVSHYR